MAKASLARKQQIAKEIETVLSTHFKSAFQGVDRDYLKAVILALCYKESTLNNNAYTSSGSPDRSFTSSSAYSSAVNSNDPQKYANSVRASTGVYGIMQVRGSYFVAGGSKSGVSELERIRSDLAPSLTVPPGGSVEDKVLGDANLTTALTAGITVLQGKWDVVPKVMSAQGNGSYYYKRANLTFPSRLSAAVGSYLGLSGADRYGTTAVGYASDIVNGGIFRIANNYDPKASYPVEIADSTSSVTYSSNSKPSTSSTVSDRIVPPGC